MLQYALRYSSFGTETLKTFIFYSCKTKMCSFVGVDTFALQGKDPQIDFGTGDTHPQGASQACVLPVWKNVSGRVSGVKSLANEACGSIHCANPEGNTGSSWKYQYKWWRPHFFVLITIRPLEFLQTSASTLVAWFLYPKGKSKFLKSVVVTLSR